MTHSDQWCLTDAPNLNKHARLYHRIHESSDLRCTWPCVRKALRLKVIQEIGEARRNQIPGRSVLSISARISLWCWIEKNLTASVATSTSQPTLAGAPRMTLCCRSRFKTYVPTPHHADRYGQRVSMELVRSPGRIVGQPQVRCSTAFCCWLAPAPRLPSSLGIAPSRELRSQRSPAWPGPCAVS